MSFDTSTQKKQREIILARVSNLYFLSTTHPHIEAVSQVVNLVSYPSNSMQNSGSPNDQAHTRPTRQVPIRCSRIRCGLLIAKSNETYADSDGLLCDVRHGHAYDAENGGDA
jgi:hypothetical protein